MKQEEYKDKALHEVFKRMATPDLPDYFNDRIMHRVCQAQRKKERRNIWIAALTSTGMLLLVLYVLIHYLSINFLEIFSILLKKPNTFPAVDISIILWIGLPLILLLWLDYLLRRRFRRS